jgi:hypothetical protein
LIVALDANCLVRWSTRLDSDEGYQRLEHLFATLSASKGKVVIPMPAFAEFLVGADEASSGWMTALMRKAAVQLAPFDARAAVECSLLDRTALAAGDKKGGRKDSWQHVKIDRQILAIARVAGAELLVSTDGNLRSTSKSVGLRAVHIDELDLPDAARQPGLPFEPSRAAGQRESLVAPPPQLPAVELRGPAGGLEPPGLES